MIRFFILLAIVSVNCPVQAGRYNKVLSIDDPSPTWKDLPGTDDKKHSLEDFRDRKVVVVVFTCNGCPYAQDAEDRLIALHKKYFARDVGLVAINVNKNEEDRLPAMKERAIEKEYKFPYLFDQSQKTAREFGAKYTPEFFVLDQHRRVVYMGALDDSPDGKQISKRLVESAIEAALSGSKAEVTETAPIGCAIRYERVRRRRAKK